MKLLGIAGTVLGLLTISSISFADEIRIPQAVYIDKFKAYTKEHGIDLNDVDGFVENHGQNFKVFTYKNMTSEQLDIIKDATFKNLRD